MGFQFNHVGGGTKTRRPITLHMKYNAACVQPSCTLITEEYGEQEVTLEELQVGCVEFKLSCSSIHTGVYRKRKCAPRTRGPVLGQGDYRPHGVQVLSQPDDHRHARADPSRAWASQRLPAVCAEAGGGHGQGQNGAARVHHPLLGGLQRLEQRHHPPLCHAGIHYWWCT